MMGMACYLDRKSLPLILIDKRVQTSSRLVCQRNLRLETISEEVNRTKALIMEKWWVRYSPRHYRTIG